MGAEECQIRLITEGQIGHGILDAPGQRGLEGVIEKSRPIASAAVLPAKLEAVLAVHHRDIVKILELIIREKLRQASAQAKVDTDAVQGIVRRGTKGAFRSGEIEPMT